MYQKASITNPEVVKRKRILDRIHLLVEKHTGHRWKQTSFLRSSPSHWNGSALDIAPDIATESEPYYAVTRRSDPVLYKREPLIRSLQKLAVKERIPFYDVGLYIEPDHIHIGLFKKNPLDPVNIKVFKWRVMKDCYPDSSTRMKLPLIS